MSIECLYSPYGPIPSSFKCSKLEDLCVSESGVQTGPFGSQLHQEDYVPFGTPIITVEHLGENRIFHRELPMVSDVDRKRLDRYVLQEGDIVFSRVGSVDRRALTRKEETGWLFSGRCLRVRPNKNLIDPEYLSWFFGLPTFKEYIRQIAVVATMPSLNTKLLSEVPIYYPALPEQRAIARILGSLDDKIELNRQMNETLEAIARAIFKSWFVDFDPVRAKAEGREPAGMDAETATLFPDSFEETELGMVPRGWRVAAIGDVVKVVGGSTPSTENPLFWNGTINFATPKDLASVTSSILLDTKRCITEEGIEHISSGLLPKGTVLLSSRAPIGYLVVTEIPVAVNQGFIALICDGVLPNYFVLNWIRQNMDTIIGNANGTTFLEISKRNFRPIPLVVPSESILEEFALKAGSLYSQMICDQKQNSILAVIRDSLLPKLLSGDIRVKDALEQERELAS